MMLRMKPRTPHQERVRDLFAAGMTPRQIAAALGVSTQAVYELKKKMESQFEAGE